jgi:hypothetical protein
MSVNKPRRLGNFAPMSAKYWTDSALMQAGEKAEVLYARVMSFCVDQRSDGFVSDIQLLRMVGHGMKDVMKRAQSLASTPTSDGDTLWSRDDERQGYWVTAWLRWNKSVDEIDALREKDAARKGNRPPDSDGPGHGRGSESGGNPDGIQSDSKGSPGPKTRQDKTTTTQGQHKDTAPDGGALFEAFWSAYPRRVGKAAAEKAWPKACKKLEGDRLVKAAGYWAGLWANARIEKQFIPYPATWLNGQRWDDEPPTPKLQAVSGGYVPFQNPVNPDEYYEEL